MFTQMIGCTTGRPTGAIFEYTKGHAGDPGNERCDEIAHGFSQGYTVELQAIG